MMWGCWPRYWVTSRRFALQRRLPIGVEQAHHQLGRSTSSSVRPDRAAPADSAATARRL